MILEQSTSWVFVLAEPIGELGEQSFVGSIDHDLKLIEYNIKPFTFSL